MRPVYGITVTRAKPQTRRSHTLGGSSQIQGAIAGLTATPEARMEPGAHRSTWYYGDSALISKSALSPQFLSPVPGTQY